MTHDVFIESLWAQDSNFAHTSEFRTLFKTVQEGEWTTDGKYQHCTTVFQYLGDGTYWSMDQCRSGSYHSDYYYDNPVITQVQPVQVEVTQWEPCVI